MISNNFIISFFHFLKIEEKPPEEIKLKFLKRVNLLRNVYKYPIIFFLYILKALRVILFFLPPKIFWISIFKSLNFLGGPFSLLIKMISSFIVLDYYE